MSLDGCPGPAKWTYLRYSGPIILAVVGAAVGVGVLVWKHLGTTLEWFVSYSATAAMIGFALWSAYKVVTFG